MRFALPKQSPMIKGSSFSVLEKPYVVTMCIVKIYVMDIISINKTKTKESKEKKTKTCCGGSEKSPLNVFLYFSCEEELIVPFINF